MFIQYLPVFLDTDSLPGFIPPISIIYQMEKNGKTEQSFSSDEYDKSEGEKRAQIA